MKKNRLGFPSGDEEGRHAETLPPFPRPLSEQWCHEALMLLASLCCHHPSSLFRVRRLGSPSCEVLSWVPLQRGLLLLLSHFSRVRLCATPKTAAHQAPPSLGFSTQEQGVGCHFLLQCMKVKSESEVAQSCPTLSDPMDCSHQAPPSMGFSRQEYWSGVPLPSPQRGLERPKGHQRQVTYEPTSRKLVWSQTALLMADGGGITWVPTVARLCEADCLPPLLQPVHSPSCWHFLRARSSWGGWIWTPSTWAQHHRAPAQAPPTTNFSGRKLLEAEESRAPLAVFPNPWSARPGCMQRTWRGGAELKPATSKCLSGMQIIILSLKESWPQRLGSSDLPLPKRIARACQNRASTSGSAQSTGQEVGGGQLCRALRSESTLRPTVSLWSHNIYLLTFPSPCELPFSPLIFQSPTPNTLFCL